MQKFASRLKCWGSKKIWIIYNVLIGEINEVIDEYDSSSDNFTV